MSHRGASAVFVSLVVAPLALACASVPAQEVSEDALPVKPPPVPTGIIPLPQGPPPTGLQAPVPSPAERLRNAERPLVVSPPISAIRAYVAHRVLTMRDAISIALYTSRDFALAEAQLVEARGRTGQARAGLGLQATTDTELTYFDQATTADLGALLGPAGQSIPPLVITPQFNPTISASLMLPLDVTGVLHAAVSQAQFDEVAARIDVNRARNQVVYNVKTAFYAALRAQAELVVAADNVNNSLARLNEANSRYAAGTAPRFDVITAQRDVANAQQGLIDARSQVSLALAALKDTIGIDIKTPITITGAGAIEYPPGVKAPVTPPPGPGAPPLEPSRSATPGAGSASGASQAGAAPPAPSRTVPPVSVPAADTVSDPLDLGPEYAALVKEALRTRPEVLEAEARTAAARRGVAYARRSILPSLHVSLSDVYTPNAAGFTRRNVGAATLGIVIPLYDAGLTRSRVEEARGQVAASEIAHRTTVDQVQIDVERAYVALSQARNRVAVADVGLAQAKEAYRLAQVRYAAGVSLQQGVSPELELSNAQDTLAQAQSNQVDALYDYNSARAQLDWSVGRYGFTGATPGYPHPPSASVPGVGH